MAKAKSKKLIKQEQFFKDIVRKYSKRIDAGVKFLDKEFGRSKWLERIDERILRLSSARTCVTGQLYDAHWQEFIDKMEEKVGTENRAHKEAVSLGFLIQDDKEDEEGGYDILTRLWFSKISVLRIEAAMGVLTPPPMSSAMSSTDTE